MTTVDNQNPAELVFRIFTARRCSILGGGGGGHAESSTVCSHNPAITLGTAVVDHDMQVSAHRKPNMPQLRNLPYMILRSLIRFKVYSLIEGCRALWAYGLW